LLLAASAVSLLLAGCGASSSTSSHPSSPTSAASKAPGATATTAAATTDPAVIMARSTVPVLCFHQVRNWRASDSRSDRGIITPPAVLDRQLATLKQAGYTPITDDALYAHLTTGAPLPAKPVLLTFDDGSESQVSEALPILKRYGFPSTYFPMTIVLGKQYWMTKAQVKQIQADGVTIGSHTYDHNPVTKYDAAAVKTELVAPREELSQITGRPVVDFAYPYGSWNRSSPPKVRSAGYRMAFGLDTPEDPSDPLHSYPRVIVPPTLTAQQLLALVEKAPHPTSNGAQAGE
jgi:peptidoglycan/xylan/chitin deacetylase (PgdA/CDA1 family)